MQRAPDAAAVGFRDLMPGEPMAREGTTMRVVLAQFAEIGTPSPRVKVLHTAKALVICFNVVHLPNHLVHPSGLGRSGVRRCQA